MKATPPPLLLAHYHELGDLRKRTEHSSPGREGIIETVEAAKRSLEILKAWPDEYWPLKSKEVRDLWPDREPLIQFLESAIEEASTYMGTYSLEDFQKWNKPRLDVFGALYYFRKKRKTAKKATSENHPPAAP